ncbi:M20/M25/M40 family metallo-hydrolase [Haliea sp. E1-2-M8]|uniref:M20/M25/M40 family metallo-hydrolase n=1 Tax=Haliea sp. E1-2-M8 TaxID=3064706 RepID=UPI002719909A|nr:M20/M25/M40 family metallo-hydrolase [Haliea sp. E1-2-M8]MDO8861173.1 M20/M25/M40 family metallo-hydrolase [Haliea sp. E1-2-M8]
MAAITRWLGMITVAMAATTTTAQEAVLEEEAVPFHRVAFDILRDSIPMRTAAGFGEVPRLASFLEQRFLVGGFPQEDVMVIPHADTAALVVRYRGDGRSGKKPILLSAHMDVVDAYPEDWERDPFTLIEEGGFYFGRGVADNKFDIAVLTTTFLRLKSEGFVPSRDLVIAFTGDEETEMATTQLLTSQYRELIDAEFAFVVDGGGGQLDEDGNPFSFVVTSAEKTYATFTMTARNPGGHSSLPRKDNAIYDLAQALRKLQAHEFPVMATELTRSFFARSAPLVGGEVGAAMQAFADGSDDPAAVALLREHPEYAGTTGTTCVATMLSAGHAENALPQSATATINCRIFPGIGIEETLAELQAVVADDTLSWAILDNPIASDPSPLREDLFAAIEQAVHIDYPGVPIVPAMASGATDALHFRAAGIPSYTLTGIFLKPEDEFAHGLNERVTVFSLPNSLTLWHALLTDLAGD